MAHSLQSQIEYDPRHAGVSASLRVAL
jgi:hypothetical protein